LKHETWNQAYPVAWQFRNSVPSVASCSILQQEETEETEGVFSRFVRQPDKARVKLPESRATQNPPSDGLNLWRQRLDPMDRELISSRAALDATS